MSEKNSIFDMFYWGNCTPIPQFVKFLWVLEMRTYLSDFLNQIFLLPQKLRLFDKIYDANDIPMHQYVNILRIPEM